MHIENVDYSVDGPDGHEHVFGTSGEATVYALANGIRTIDVLCWTRTAAEAAGLLEEYDTDPEHSVTCRYRIDDTGAVVDVLGMIP